MTDDVNDRVAALLAGIGRQIRDDLDVSYLMAASTPRMRISCAICAKPVDRIEVMSDGHKRAYRIKVFCHGDTDQMDLSMSFIQEGSPEELEKMEGLAFTTKRIV